MSELQLNDVVVDTNAKTITGTLKYVTGYTGFSNSKAEQSGNYVALKLTSEGADKVEFKLSGEYKEIDDGYGIVLVKDTTKTKPLYVKATKGEKSTEVQYDISKLTLLPKPGQ